MTDLEIQAKRIGEMIADFFLAVAESITGQRFRAA